MTTLNNIFCKLINIVLQVYGGFKFTNAVSYKLADWVYSCDI